MPKEFDQFFETMFNEAMVYGGRAAIRDRQFTHYVLSGKNERTERAWQKTSRELVDYVQTKASFVFDERTGFGIIRLAFCYAVIRWDEEIFWKQIDPIECSLVIEEAKNNNRFADVTVLPIAISEEVRQVDEEVETSEVHEVVFGQVYIDRCLNKVKQLLINPSFTPHRIYQGNSIWFESEELGEQISGLSEEDVRKLHDEDNERATENPSAWTYKGEVGYLVTGVFSVQLSFSVQQKYRFVFEVPSKQRKELLEFAKQDEAYIPTMETDSNVSVPVSLDNLLGQ